jgi:hypothetical protein
MITVLLSLALAAGAVINAAQATSMAMDMSAGGHSDGMVPGCDGCPGGDDGAMACAAACVAPATAVLPKGFLVGMALTRVFSAARTQALVDHHRPPDPYPPRTTVLG